MQIPRLNDNGQTLVVFVILLPVILALMAYLIDIGYITYEKRKLTSIADLGCAYLEKEKDLIKIEDLIQENDSLIEKINIELSDSSITLEKQTPSIFGTLLGFKEYTIKTKIDCSYEK